MGSTAAEETFRLRWDDFDSNVSGAFRELRAESDLFDVTLGCSDGGGDRSLQAHKVILSACSAFFKRVLRQSQSQSHSPHPYVYLRGVSFRDLSSALDFMYHGEVSVAQEQLNSFLAVAEDLQIKGLTHKQPGDEEARQVQYYSWLYNLQCLFQFIDCVFVLFLNSSINN